MSDKPCFECGLPYVGDTPHICLPEKKTENQLLWTSRRDTFRNTFADWFAPIEKYIEERL